MSVVEIFGAGEGWFDAFPKHQSVTESSYNNSLAERHIWSTIKTLPATLPAPSSMGRGPRTGVTEGVSLSPLEFTEGGRAKNGRACISDCWFT
jgi:hypothetical protein